VRKSLQYRHYSTINNQTAFVNQSVTYINASDPVAVKCKAVLEHNDSLADLHRMRTWSKAETQDTFFNDNHIDTVRL